MTTEIDYTRFPMFGGTVHNMTDPQCRPRCHYAPSDPEAICAACAKGNSEHRATQVCTRRQAEAREFYDSLRDQTPTDLGYDNPKEAW